MRRFVRASRLWPPRGSRDWIAMVRCLRLWGALGERSGSTRDSAHPAPPPGGERTEKNKDFKEKVNDQGAKPPRPSRTRSPLAPGARLPRGGRRTSPLAQPGAWRPRLLVRVAAADALRLGGDGLGK